jgi:hypothetical protein
MMAFAAAQAPPAAPAKKFKDDAEQALAIAANNEKDPKAQLEKLDKWKHDYPESEYDVDRLDLYFKAYAALKQNHEQIGVAKEMLKKFPNSMGLLRSILVAFQQISSPTAEDRAAANDAAAYIVNHADEVFAPDQAKANGMTDDQWKQLKPQMVAYANAQIDKMAEDQGIDAVIALLKKDPTRIALNGWLGQQYVAQGKTDPTKIVLALFHYARVSEYDGPGAAPAATKTGARKYFDKQYAGYHGSAEGADQVLAVAKTNAVPPPDFTIVSITAISEKKIKEDEEKRKANPMITLWTDTKAAILRDPAALDAVKDAELPGTATPGVTKFKGKIVSTTPALNPKKVVVAVEKDGVADATLVLDAALPGKGEVGDELEFSGVVKDVAKEPYMMTFAVEKANVEGWKGKKAPGPASPAKKAAPKKAN